MIALGEPKEGIDPVGADEHWKTGNTALGRMRDGFGAKGFKPEIFLVGAAISESMAGEIWDQLEGGTLANAANLSDDDQVASLCQWLVAIGFSSSSE